MKLNNEQDAIKQAIEGGWKPFEWSVMPKVKTISPRDKVWFRHPERGDISRPTTEIFLDPLFWQALGNARGWGMIPSGETGRSGAILYENAYKQAARCWFETRISGGDEAKFWESLP